MHLSSPRSSTLPASREAARSPISLLLLFLLNASKSPHSHAFHLQHSSFSPSLTLGGPKLCINALALTTRPKRQQCHWGHLRCTCKVSDSPVQLCRHELSMLWWMENMAWVIDFAKLMTTAEYRYCIGDPSQRVIKKYAVSLLGFLSEKERRYFLGLTWQFNQPFLYANTVTFPLLQQWYSSWWWCDKVAVDAVEKWLTGGSREDKAVSLVSSWRKKKKKTWKYFHVCVHFLYQINASVPG